MKTILIVDDEAPILKLLESILSSHNYDIYSTTDGQKALDMLEQIVVDLVITDVIMPDMDGIEFIGKMKKQRPEVKIIAMSGGGSYDTETYLEIAIKLGADAVLEKPFSLEAVSEAINKVSA